MGLIPKSKYQGQTNGRRAATPEEYRKYGSTSYAKGVKPRVQNKEGVKIIVRYETWNRLQKKWQPTRIKGALINSTWTFRTLQAAISYIPDYMRKKGGEPANKAGREYYLSEAGYWKDGQFLPYNNNPDWKGGTSFFSQWILKGKFFMRVTFEQYKPLEYRQSDYHNQLVSPWSNDAQITRTNQRGQKTSRSFRTYQADDDALDTTARDKYMHRGEKARINQEYEEYKRMEKQIKQAEELKQNPYKVRTKRVVNRRKIKQYLDDRYVKRH